MKRGKHPPKLNLNDSLNDADFLEYFNSIISVSSTQQAIDTDAIHFQKHRHTFSCYKSNKGVVKVMGAAVVMETKLR